MLEKNFSILGILILTAGTVLATTGSAYRNIKIGHYECPTQTKSVCSIDILKNGETRFGQHCKENSQKLGESKYAPMIKLGKCKFKPDSNKYFKCEYADTSCNVIILHNNETTISCPNNKSVSKEQVSKAYEKVLENVKDGLCKPLYIDIK